MNRKAHWLRYLPRMIVGGVLLSVTLGMIVFVRHMLSGDIPHGKKTVQQITLLQPPPPPPPPKVEEKPPEPEVKEEVKQEPPEPEAKEDAANEPPPGADLGLDAEGGAGGDAFGLVGKKGGRDLIGGGGGSRFGWYSTIVQRDILDLLAEVSRVRSQRYSVMVKLWINPEGRVTRSELLSSSGNQEVDRSLTTALADLRQLSERPPEDLPQPVKLRITSRL